MFKKVIVLLIISVGLMMGLTACAGSTENIPIEETESESLPPVAAIKAREALSRELGIGMEEISILSYEQKTWLDSCLGLGGIAESCLRTEVSGWLVELSVDGESYKARTDELGEQVRFEK